MNKHTQNLTVDGIDYIRANMRSMLQRSVDQDEVEDCPSEWIAEMVFDGLLEFFYDNDCDSDFSKMNSVEIDKLCDDYLDVALVGSGWSDETKVELIRLAKEHIECLKEAEYV